MEKVTFKANIKLPKVPKGASSQVLEQARKDAQISITIKGTFTNEEAGVLELLLKSWHDDKQQA